MNNQKDLDKIVLKELRKTIDSNFYEQIRSVIRDSGKTENYRIRDRHCAGEHTYGDEPFDDMWSTINHDGNEIFGQISIGLHNGKYFNFNYCVEK